MVQLLVSLVFSLLVLLLCWRRPSAGRLVVGVLFLVMAFGVNTVVALTNPAAFVALGTDAPLLPLYRWAFEHVVALAPALFGLLTAAYEIAVGLLILGRGKAVRWGLWGGALFLLGITPLGVWTLANPLLALALAVLLRERYSVSVLGMLRSRFSQAPKVKEARDS